jgi:hypothetical protein
MYLLSLTIVYYIQMSLSNYETWWIQKVVQDIYK